MSATADVGSDGGRPPAWRRAGERVAAATATTFRLLGRAVGAFFADRGGQLAASIAYYALFATFPLAIASVALFGLVVADEAARTQVIDFLVDNLPLREDSGRRDISQALNDVTGDAGTFGVIGLVGLLFSASGLMGSLRHGVNRAFGVDDRRPPLVGKLLDILLVLGFGLVVLTSLAFTLVSRLAVDVAQALTDAIGPAPSLLPRVALALGQLTPLVLSVVLFLALYRFLPARREGRLRDCLPGAVLAAVLYEAIKTVFAFYLQNVASYGAVYGPIATVIAFAFFVYLSAIAFLLGAEAAAEWPGVRDGPRDDGPKEPLRVRARRALRGLVLEDDR